jgi:hypothetical protein
VGVEQGLVPVALHAATVLAHLLGVPHVLPDDPLGTPAQLCGDVPRPDAQRLWPRRPGRSLAPFARAAALYVSATVR